MSVVVSTIEVDEVEEVCSVTIVGSESTGVSISGTSVESEVIELDV